VFWTLYVNFLLNVGVSQFLFQVHGFFWQLHVISSNDCDPTVIGLCWPRFFPQAKQIEVRGTLHFSVAPFLRMLPDKQGCPSQQMYHPRLWITQKKTRKNFRECVFLLVVVVDCSTLKVFDLHLCVKCWIFIVSTQTTFFWNDFLHFEKTSKEKFLIWVRSNSGIFYISPPCALSAVKALCYA